LVNLKDCILYEIKIHVCYVFMQTIIPLAYQDLLPIRVLDAFTDLNHFLYMDISIQEVRDYICILINFFLSFFLNLKYSFNTMQILAQL
jgi:hypothetical protein